MTVKQKKCFKFLGSATQRIFRQLFTHANHIKVAHKRVKMFSFLYQSKTVDFSSNLRKTWSRHRKRQANVREEEGKLCVHMLTYTMQRMNTSWSRGITVIENEEQRVALKTDIQTLNESDSYTKLNNLRQCHGLGKWYYFYFLEKVKYWVDNVNDYDGDWNTASLEGCGTTFCYGLVQFDCWRFLCKIKPSSDSWRQRFKRRKLWKITRPWQSLPRKIVTLFLQMIKFTWYHFSSYFFSYGDFSSLPESSLSLKG